MTILLNRPTRQASAESDSPSPRRFDARRMRDMRWVVGVVLLIAGFAGTLQVISGFDDSVSVWAAKRNLMPGETFGPDDLVATKVRLGSGETKYLTQKAAPRGVVQRHVGVGELLPAAAVGSADAVTVREISVKVDAGNADVLKPGALVELWVAKKRSQAGATGYDEPTKVSTQAVVSHVGSKAGGVVTVGDTRAVQVLVGVEHVSAVIDAVNSDSRITLVPAVSGAGS